MTALADGRFLFVDAKGNLRLESSVTVGTETEDFGLLYGGTTLSFSYNEAAHLMAMAVPVGGYQPEKTNGGEFRTVLRLYKLEKDSLTDLVDEYHLAFEHPSVAWVGVDHIAVSQPGSDTTLLFPFDAQRGKLQVMQQHSGSMSFAALYHFGVIHHARQAVEVFDLKEDTALQTVDLPNRRGRQGTKRECKSVGSSGNFVFIMNNDATLHGVYVTKGSVRKLSPMLIELAGPARSRHRPRKHSESISGDTEEDHELESCVTPESDTHNHTNVYVAALSSGQCLVTANDCSTIIKYKYLKQGASLKLVERISIPFIKDGGEVVALSTTRCLIRLPLAPGGTKSAIYRSVRLNCGPLDQGRSSVAANKITPAAGGAPLPKEAPKVPKPGVSTDANTSGDVARHNGGFNRSLLIGVLIGATMLITVVMRVLRSK